MATSKTLAPTNVTISIPAMTDQPDASVFSNCVDKEADAINALNSKLTTVVDNSLTPGTGITIVMQRKLKIGKMVTYNLAITTTEQIQTGTPLVSGFELHNGGFNGVPTIVAYNNNAATAFFYLHDNGDIRPIAAFGAGTWRMAFTYICQ